MKLSRREFLGATATGWTLASGDMPSTGDPNLHLGTFRFDVTPPIGHSCCGGWIKPVEAVDDPLEAAGFVLLGLDEPIVIVAVDWTGILNDAHVEWRKALADAAGTRPERVAVQCVHQHNAPMACLEAERIIAAQDGLPHIVDTSFFRRCLDAGRQAISNAVKQPRRVTHVAAGQARVDRVAANRRVARDANGKVLAMRGSSCRDAALCALPDGLIDPFLKTVAFYEHDRKIAACHYYATHPMSYYGDGRVSSDFVGLARKRRQADEPDCLHVYFTGCAGNVAAGKYNDGSHELRPILTQRIYDGIVASESVLRPEPIGEAGWAVAHLLTRPRAELDAAALHRQIADKAATVVNRNRPSYQLAWLRRVERQLPIVISRLQVNGIRLLHLPAESFVEYQLRAQDMAGASAFVAVAAYGDGGPWYIPVREEYPNGGYEVSVAFCDPAVDDQFTACMRQML